jgi:hypothetical protein
MRTVVLLLAAFGAGIALGYAFGSGDADSGRASSAPRPVAGPEPAVGRSRAASPTLREALGSIPMPAEVARGEGTIRGHIRTKGGEPIAGARVVATPSQERPRRKYRRGLAARDEEDVEDWVRRAVAGRKWREAARREARTDATGAYTITGLTDAKHSVAAYSVGYHIMAARGSSAYNVKPDATVDFLARPVIELAVDVLRPDGSRPSQAQIECRGESTRKENWLPDERWIQLWPGTYTVRAVADQSRSEEQTILVEAGKPGPSLVFRLKESPGVRGRILFPPELQPAQVSVYALRFAGAEPPNDARLTAEGKNTSTAGAYAFENLEPGGYLVGAGYGNKSVDVTAVVRIADEVVEQHLQLPPPDTDHFVIVHVFGPEGERPASVRFETSYSGGSFGGSGGGRAFPRSDGAHYVPHHSWDTLRYGSNHPDPHWYVKAIADGFGAIKKEYAPGRDHELTIRFRPGARLTARIAGFVDSGHEGHLLVVLKAEGEYAYLGRRFREEFPDEKGRQMLGPVQPGRYEAILVLRRPLGVSWPLNHIPLELRPGENELAIPLPALHTLTVVSEPGRRVSVVAAEDRHNMRSLQRSTGEDGKATFEHLPTGAYRVTVRKKTGRKHESVTIELPAQSVVRLP